MGTKLGLDTAGERAQVIHMPRVHDVRDSKLGRERIILIEVLWGRARAHPEIFIRGGGVVDSEAIYIYIYIYIYLYISLC
jgi:hypothetical protein